MAARDSDELAAKLGRPAASLSAFRSLTPEQIGLLSDAIDQAMARRAEAVDAAFREGLPALPRRLVTVVTRYWTQDGRRRGWGPRRPEEGGVGAPPGAAEPQETR